MRSAHKRNHSAVEMCVQYYKEQSAILGFSGGGCLGDGMRQKILWRTKIAEPFCDPTLLLETAVGCVRIHMRYISCMQNEDRPRDDIQEIQANGKSSRESVRSANRWLPGQSYWHIKQSRELTPDSMPSVHSTGYSASHAHSALVIFPVLRLSLFFYFFFSSTGLAYSVDDSPQDTRDINNICLHFLCAWFSAAGVTTGRSRSRSRSLSLSSGNRFLFGCKWAMSSKPTPHIALQYPIRITIQHCRG